MSDDKGVPQNIGNVVALRSAEDIDMEAASWLVVLSRDEVCIEDREAFQRWMEASERHAEAFGVLSSVWEDLAALEDLPDIARGAPEEKAAQMGSLSRRGLIGMAAGLAVAAGSASLWLASAPDAPAVQRIAWSTALGEQKTINLPDGSVLQLNTASQAEIEFTKDLRLVRLTEGEAHFDVAKNKSRPFRVVSPGGVVEAVGTAFSVRIQPSRTMEVLVDEGIVSVEPPAPGDIASMAPPVLPEEVLKPRPRLVAGQKAVISSAGEEIVTLPERELRRQLSWRQGMLAFSGEPLSEVVADVSRYTDMQIDIADPDLAARPVAGYFRIGEMDSLFESLELSFDIDVERVDQRHVRLVSAGRP